ncbi:uncharacterized protein LOC130449163 [Diorhabda sublineata]|uniref:uncharacterized protein LOC130449163 n=1 Tax=Diorhabda sublineata TaxID=1163346 RepID=UPI0024E0B548|nr:uncharacterized protein LOC130449163 [Diorhabda sublineata]
MKHTVEKADKKIAQLRRLMPNVGGPGYCKRRVLCQVMHSVLLYAAPAWREAMKIHSYKERLMAAQRKGLLMVAAAYRTVSAEAVQVIAGFPPIDLMIAERCFLYKIGGRLAGNRRMARERTYKKWQERDDPAHVLYECARWGEERARLKEQLGCDLPMATEIIGKMLEDKVTWNAVTTYMTIAMNRNEKEDR